MKDKEYVKCPVCNGHPRKWLTDAECQIMGVRYGSYEDCPNCEDGYVLASIHKPPVKGDKN